MTALLARLHGQRPIPHRLALAYSATWRVATQSSALSSLPHSDTEASDFNTQNQGSRIDQQSNQEQSLSAGSSQVPSSPSTTASTWADLLKHYTTKQQGAGEDSSWSPASPGAHITPNSPAVRSNPVPRRRVRQHAPEWEHFSPGGCDVSDTHGDLESPVVGPPGAVGLEEEALVSETVHGEVRLNSSIMRQIRSIGEFRPKKGDDPMTGYTLPPELARTLGLSEGQALEGDNSLEEEEEVSAEEETLPSLSVSPHTQGNDPAADVDTLDGQSQGTELQGQEEGQEARAPVLSERKPVLAAFLSGVPAAATAADVREAVGVFGHVSDVVMKPASGSKSPFAFVYFKDKGSLIHAVSQQAIEILGYSVSIKMSNITAKVLQGQAATSAPTHSVVHKQQAGSPEAVPETPDQSRDIHSRPGVDNGVERGNVVRLLGVPASASLSDIRQSLMGFGALRWIQMNPDGQGGITDVTACFETAEAMHMAVSRGHMLLERKMVRVVAKANRQMALVRLLRDTGRWTPVSHDALRKACAALAPVALFRVRSHSIVDVGFATDLGWAYMALQVRRANIPGWRCANNPRLAVALMKEGHSSGEQDPVLLTMRKSVKQCQLALEECIVEMEDIESALERYTLDRHD